MKTIYTKQRGFLTIAAGLGITAILGTVGSILVANHELNDKNDSTVEQQIVMQDIETRIDNNDNEPQQGNND